MNSFICLSRLIVNFNIFPQNSQLKVSLSYALHSQVLVIFWSEGCDSLITPCVISHQNITSAQYTVRPVDYGPSWTCQMRYLGSTYLHKTQDSLLHMHGELNFKILGQNLKNCGFFSND